jgi:cytoskeletal protein CcmA (bactofilin family)
MFHGDGLFTKKDDAARKDPRTLHPASPPPPPQRAFPPEPQKAELAPAPKPASETKGSKLIVGPDIKLKGAEITDCDTLVVEGRVEASMDSRAIQIAQQGVFCGTVGIDVAEIHGRFEGELTARKQLVIHATGKVTGKIRYGKLTIEEGGELSGDIGAINAGDAARKDKPLLDKSVLAKPLSGLV